MCRTGTGDLGDPRMVAGKARGGEPWSTSARSPIRHSSPEPETVYSDLGSASIAHNHGYAARMRSEAGI